MAPEICSAHRCLAAEFILGWVPRPNIIVWSNQVCDNTSKSGELLMELYDTRGFFLDRPYRFTDKEATYFAQELEEMVRVLEEATGRKMDWDRMREVLRLAKRATDLHGEIYKMRSLVPMPVANRRSVQLMFVNWLWGGTQKGVDYFELVLQEKPWNSSLMPPTA